MKTVQFVRVLPTAAFNYRTLEQEVNDILQHGAARVVSIHTIVIDRIGGPSHETVIVFERDEPDDH